MAHPWMENVSLPQLFIVSSKTRARIGIGRDLLWINYHQTVSIACLLITRFPSRGGRLAEAERLHHERQN